MLRYVITLFLINTYSRSLGAPTNSLSVSHTITELLGSLTRSCENSFITKQIENTLHTCSAAQHKELFECLIFYDINNQLCSAIHNSKLSIEQDFSAQVNKNMNVKNLCEAAKDWTFSNNYDVSMNLSTVFQDPLKCEKFCGVDDLFSTDASFICKYYNWGWSTLNTQNQPTTPKTLPSAEEVNNANVVANVVVSQNGTTHKELDANIESPVLNEIEKPDKQDMVDIEVTVPTANDEKNTIVTNTTIVSDGTTPSKNGSNSTVIYDMNLSAYNNASVDKTPLSVKNNVISTESQTPNTQNKTEDESPASDARNDNFKDDDPEELDEDFIPSGHDVPIDGIDSYYKKDFYSPVITPEDDHFFTFFLTAVVMVILLYILYHNKGKVTKVFLGLIVEGRQNGRRRNSRGHAYRRLDTLEQAMSGNLAAQPSKIIY